MLISKEAFLFYVGAYKKAFEEQDKFHEALKPFFNLPVCIYQHSLVDAYERLLVEVSECQEEDDIFDWWATDSPNDNKVITVKDSHTGVVTEYDVATANVLYDYLYAMYHKAK